MMYRRPPTKRDLWINRILVIIIVWSAGMWIFTCARTVQR